jgi:hypothetical protein
MRMHHAIFIDCDSESVICGPDVYPSCDRAPGFPKASKHVPLPLLHEDSTV